MTACVIFSPSRFGVGLQLGENHRGNFRRRKLSSACRPLPLPRRVAVGGLHDLVRHAFDFLLHLVEFAAHEALDGINRVARVGDGLALGGLADQALAALGERDDRRRGARAFGIFQNERLAAFHDGHAGVRGSQINA